ncbi:MAG TPA: hypothetical protein DEQ34_14110 [Balneolaceae bacterium]|nr:hypothetical protein [Balneolaceae bacterium]|tara:strand:- start:5315 stop:6130 length:816 start_codon:yes stop_codon:yes gene_type:complete
MQIENELLSSIRKLEILAEMDLEIISWASPIIMFGDIDKSHVATVGINPSDKEFLDSKGNEIDGALRRFHTLRSLGLNKWSQVSENQLSEILRLNQIYFKNNPYDKWFKKLDFLMSGSDLSYYFPYLSACHLDLIPFATKTKWGSLNTQQKECLLSEGSNILGELVKKSTIKILLLNGKSVVDNFLKISDVDFKSMRQERWDLPRSGKDIPGYSFEGVSSRIGEIVLQKKIFVLGYNHNIQSSFGVTRNVMVEIRNWIAEKIKYYGANNNS